MSHGINRLPKNNLISLDEVSWEYAAVPRNGLLNGTVSNKTENAYDDYVTSKAQRIGVFDILNMSYPESMCARKLVILDTQYQGQPTYADRFISSHELVHGLRLVVFVVVWRRRIYMSMAKCKTIVTPVR